MRIKCPICGERDQREFTVTGAAMLSRPEGETFDMGWHGFLHLRENPAGVSEELWHHSAGCRAWLKVTRNTVTHEVISVELAKPEGGA